MEKVKFSKKLLVCLLAGLLSGAVLRRLLSLSADGWMPMIVIWALALLLVFGCLEYAFIWHRRERKGKGNSLVTLSFLHGLLLYTLAYDFSAFGWHKIFHLQMVVPLGVLDLPFGSLDSETLTWAYFRRSYPFTVAIAVSQISSAYLLLFARTRLLGLIIMVPVLLNIILIDIFYQLHPGVLAHALILFACVIYLLMQSYTSLVNFFFKTIHLVSLPDTTKYTKQWLRAAVVLIPLALLAVHRFPDRHPQFTGKYTVSDLKVNGKPVAAQSVKDSVLTTVYMDLQDDLVLEFNHYKSRYIGTYHFNKATDSINVNWRFPRDFKAGFAGTFLPAGKPGSYHFSGTLQEDKIEMNLNKVPEP
ncbi:hypothetical protein [Chitinophaga sp. MM2321]|uniref:hypothetical protein n=1 Tax=Chitinophaga sp. MM2321 TaxID=3137178 RepID=UPI0032D58E4D